MDLADYRKKLTSGRYSSLGAAKKALGRSTLTEEDKVKATKAADKYFAALAATLTPAGASPTPVAKSTKAAVAPAKRKPGRPRKEATPVVEVPAKRKPGRPAGSKSKKEA